MTLAMVPLIVLFELSILMAAWMDRAIAAARRRRTRRRPSRRVTVTAMRRRSRPGRMTPMLFDLRARGRRRTVQAVYLTLAILMGGGLVLFGIGGSVSGGLFDALGLTDGSSGSATGGRDTLEDVEKRAAAQVRANPRNAPAWAELARTRFQLAGQGEENYSQADRAPSPGGARPSWGRRSRPGSATWRWTRRDPTPARRR